ncbi:MAG: acetolactate synthase small subunit [Bryobacterales bacterium]|nr:acetolactate synthase small subunit [Acidobacteriota bacterium]MCB9385271.1 acetolactate synthase small subunit [Bryobacterales bacterium]
MNQLISLLVENKPGALMRVAGVLTSRGYNIESLTVAKTLDPTLSSMTIVAEVSEENSDLLIKQITRLVDVVKAVDLTESKAVQRELALVKVSDVKPEMRSALTREAEIFRARIVDVAPTHYTLEVTGSPDKIDALIELLHHYGNVEMIRSGSMAMARMPNNRLPMPTFRMDSDVPDIAPVETN